MENIATESKEDILIKSISTVLFVGYLPFVPGTWGSLVGLGLFILFKGDVRLNAFALGIALALGFLYSGKAETVFGKRDPKPVVIDEVAGMLLSLLFLPFDLKLALIGFIVFRILDTLKPFPAGKLQDLKGSAGIMLDDLAVALYTNLFLRTILRLF